MNNIKKTCNKSLPTNALNVPDIKVGDEIYTSSDATIRKVSEAGPYVIRFTDGTYKRVTDAGTVRLANVRGYNYHEGHSCGIA